MSKDGVCENWVIYENTPFAIFCAVGFSTSVPKKSSNCKILTGRFQGGRYKRQNRVISDWSISGRAIQRPKSCQFWLVDFRAGDLKAKIASNPNFCKTRRVPAVFKKEGGGCSPFRIKFRSIYDAQLEFHHAKVFFVCFWKFKKTKT